MTWVKICGTTNLEDALSAVEAGADALGFVFYGKSPRRIDPATAREIVEKLPSNVDKVGVFVDEPVATILETAARIGLTGAQLHGATCRKSEFIQALKAGSSLKVFLVLSAAEIDGGVDWNEIRRSSVSAVFLDSGTPQVPGGTGKVFDWKTAASGIQPVTGKLRIVVAGGLTSRNVTEAVRILKPWGVDVASGVEGRPGKKDPEKIRAFIDAVRKLEEKN
jgi:phosphoribosylanthranilate isomerase